jgi:hypothetical protein
MPTMETFASISKHLTKSRQNYRQTGAFGTNVEMLEPNVVNRG